MILSSTLFLTACSFFAQAENACNESVRANYFVDGIPAYSQCSQVSNSSIYSDDGINTRTQSGGTNWVRTQGGGGYQCTELATRYLRFKWNIANPPRAMAGEWCNQQLSDGLIKTSKPSHGDIIVFGRGVCGAGSTTGHVAIVDLVHSDGKTVTIVEQNSVNRRVCNNSCATCFIHVIANTVGTSNVFATKGTANGIETIQIRRSDLAGKSQLIINSLAGQSGSITIFDVQGKKLVDEMTFIQGNTILQLPVCIRFKVYICKVAVQNQTNYKVINSLN